MSTPFRPTAVLVMSSLIGLFLLAGCTESPVAPFEDDMQDDMQTVQLSTEEVGTAQKIITYTVCHMGDDGIQPLDVPYGDPFQAHLAHGDGQRYTEAADQPGYWYQDDCELLLDTMPPVCTYEVSEDGASVVFTAVDDASGISSLSISYDPNSVPYDWKRLSFSTYTVSFYAIDPDVDAWVNAWTTDGAGRFTNCGPVTF